MEDEEDHHRKQDYYHDGIEKLQFGCQSITISKSMPFKHSDKLFASLLQVVEEAGEPNAGCLLDLAHTHATKEHLELVIPKLKKRLFYVHLADNDGTHSLHLPAGKGNIDFRSVFHSLKEIGYDSFVNVDYGGVPPDQILEEVRRGRAYFQECLEAA